MLIEQRSIENLARNTLCLIKSVFGVDCLHLFIVSSNPDGAALCVLMWAGWL